MAFDMNSAIYTIICLKSVGVRKLQVAILARSPREMFLTDRILPRYILSRVRVSVRPIIFFMRKNPNQSRTRMLFISIDPLCGQLNNWIGSCRTDPSGWCHAKASGYSLWRQRLRSAGIRVQTPCREQYLFHFYCLRLTMLTLNKS